MYTFSREMSSLKRSVMRDLLSVAVNPQNISFAGGLPASEYLPTAEYQQCLDTVIQRDSSRVMQYSPQLSPLQDWIAAYMNKLGVDCCPEQIFITNGGQHGLAILSRLFLDPGAPAVIEAVTFTGIQQVTAGRGADMRLIPTDLNDGIDVEALEAAFQQEPRPRLAVIIPDFHNPLGVSLSETKRRKIAELAAQYQIPVIEDDPYSALRFKGDPIPPVAAYDHSGHVFYLGSFSKMLAPAVRLGWIVAPLDLIPQITVLRESIDLESSILTQKAIYEFLSKGYLEPHLETLTCANHERMEAMLAELDKHFGGMASWTKPEGGLFVWVTFPPEIDTWEMFHEALDQHVVYVPGAAFAVKGDHRNTMRLNFSNTNPERIHEGMARLAEVVHRHIPVRG